MKEDPIPTSPRPCPAPVIGRIWHLSDLHFRLEELPGTPDKADTLDRRSEEFNRKPWDELLALARREPADLIVISGDLIEEVEPAPSAPEEPMPWYRRVFRREASRGGKPVEKADAAFEVASEFIRQLAVAHGLQDRLAERVVVCPGNHDVDWAVALSKPEASRERFVRHFGRFLAATSLATWHPLDDIRLRVLVLDTVFLGGTLVGGDKAITELERVLQPYRVPSGVLRSALVKVLRHDIGAFPLKTIERLVTRLREEAPGEGRGDVVGGHLGLVVSHYPPTTAPTLAAEVKAFELAIAADQAKQVLHAAGFRLFLHGHKHLAFARTELTQDAAGGLSRLHFLGAPTLQGEGAKGFSVIHYAVSPVTGEACVAALPYSLEELRPHPTGTRFTLTTESRAVGPIRTVRLIERIDALGDSRSDMYIHEVATTGWASRGGYYARRIAREVEIAHGQVGAPRVECLDPGDFASVTVPVFDAVRGKMTFNVELRVPANAMTDLPEKGTHTGYVERLWTNNVYALTKWHARRTGGLPWLDPSDPECKGMEWLAYVVRDPAEALEIFIRFPFRRKGRVLLRTCVEQDDGHLRVNPALHAFTRYTIDQAESAKRLRVRIHRPITGAAYAVLWELPEEQPKALRPRTLPRADLDVALGEASRVMERLSPLGGPGAKGPLVDLFREFTTDFAQRLVDADGADLDEDLEWALFVPTTRLYVDDKLPGDEDLENPIILRPLFASFPDNDERWETRWEAGRGIAGRAYGANVAVRYVDAEHRRYVRQRDAWQERDVLVYISPRPGHDRHSVLYGVPVRHDDHGDVVLGCLCVGSRHRDSKLDLGLLVADARSDFRDRLPAAMPGPIVLATCLKLLYREWREHLLPRAVR